MHATPNATASYRWFVLFLICLSVLAQMLAWLAPAAILTAIQESLNIDIGRAGSLVTLITLISGTCMFFGSLIMDRLGLRATAVISMAFISIGGGLSAFVDSYWQIVVLRILVGMGAGLSTLLPGALTMAWFPSREQPYINSFYNVFSFIAMAAAFGTPGPLLAALHGWGQVMSVLSGTAVLAFLAWLAFGRNPPTPAKPLRADRKGASGIALALRRKEIWLLVFTMVGEMWAFNTFSTYLPSFLETSRGVSRVVAGEMSSLLAFAGMGGALMCGVGCGLLGRRKPFMWPLMILALAAALVIVNGPMGLTVSIAIAALGFATAGLSPPLITVVMDLENATTQFIGGAFALIYGISFIVSFFVSVAYGALVPVWGSRFTMTAFSLPLILSIVALLLLPETGPKRRARSHRHSDNARPVAGYD